MGGSGEGSRVSAFVSEEDHYEEKFGVHFRLHPSSLRFSNAQVGFESGFSFKRK